MPKGRTKRYSLNFLLLTLQRDTSATVIHTALYTSLFSMYYRILKMYSERNTAKVFL